MPAELTPSNNQIGVIAKCFGELIVGEGLDAGRQFHCKPRMPAGCTHAVDDGAIEMRADKAHVMTARAGGQAHGRAHHAGTEDRDHRHDTGIFI